MRSDSTPQPLILVIEDEPTVLEAMVMLLEVYGYRVLGCDSIDRASDAVEGQAESPDLILADYRLRGGATGIEAIETIRRMVRRLIPALLITGDTSETWAEEALRHDVPVLRKPVSPQSLSAAIARALVPA